MGIDVYGSHMVTIDDMALLQLMDAFCYLDDVLMSQLMCYMLLEMGLTSLLHLWYTLWCDYDDFYDIIVLYLHVGVPNDMSPLSIWRAWNLQHIGTYQGWNDFPWMSFYHFQMVDNVDNPP